LAEQGNKSYYMRIIPLYNRVYVILEMHTRIYNTLNQKAV